MKIPEKIKTTIFMTLAAAGLTPALLAIPAKPGLQREAIQPDGTTVKFYVEGDERGHVMLDEEGHLLQMNSEGFLVRSGTEAYMARKAIAKSAAKAGQRRQQRKAAGKKYPGLMRNANFPATGANRSLVVLVEFSNKTFSMENPVEYFDDMLNGENFSAYGATGSVGSYFSFNSRGLFTPTFDVLGPVKLPNDYSHYGRNTVYHEEGYGDFIGDAGVEEMMVEACRILDEEGTDFSIYDANGDGEIDNVYFFYAGYGEADGGPEDTIWPCALFISDNKEIAPVELDGKLLNHCACSNELVWRSGASKDDRVDGIGAFLHEFSHVMGLPDLYSLLEGGCVTPGDWSILDVGCYLNEKRTPPNYSGFELMALGWRDPEKLTAGKYEITGLHEEDGRAYIVWSKGEENEAADAPAEFFIMENRQLTGEDSFLPGHGMLVWHVDFDQDAWDYNLVNSYASHGRVRIIEADNLPSGYEIVEIPGQKPQYLYVNHDDGDPFPGASGNSNFTSSSVPAFVDWEGRSLGLDLNEITESPAGIISFTATPQAESGAGAISAGQGARRGDVYNTAGIKVASGVSEGQAASILPPGIYFMDGRKIVLK